MIENRVFPTLADLRRSVAHDPPKPGIALAFDIPGTGGVGHLPEQVLVPEETIRALEAGVFDTLPGSLPLSELPAREKKA